MSQPDERLYTRRQAVILGRRDLCEQEGHDVQRHYQKMVNGQVVINFYNCGKCDADIKITYPELS